VVSGTYYYQGNAQYPRAIEELFVVHGAEAFTFHFECYAGLTSHLGPAVESIYKSFAIRPPANGRGNAPPSPSLLPGHLDPDHLPF
jgi:hypothetical protein